MKQIFLISFLIFGFYNSGFAQEKKVELSVIPDIHFRSFWMNTIYPKNDFKEDYALGMTLNLGAIIKYQENWKFHVGFRSFANVASSEIWELDPATGQGNRYETGLFDLLDTRSRFFGKLETLSLEFSKEKFGIKAGRMGINSDWINAQDGRLSPTAVEGVNAWIAPDKRWKFSVWGIGRMSIRGSSEWLSVGETVGIYPVGRTVSGKPAQYFGNTSSDWLGIWEIDRKIASDSKIHFSNTIAQNLFSTYWLSFEKNRKIESGIVIMGLQSGFQHGIGEGGNPNPDLKYKEADDINYALSGRIGWKNMKWTTHLNYTHVGGEGRWLSPREWGKDAWYTFIPRERNEGFESVNAVVAYGEYRFQKPQLTLYGHLGFHWLSKTEDAFGNKYNFPSYRQVNLGVKLQANKVANLDFHFILVSKEPLTSSDLSPNQIYNKVELLHFNGIINWRWN
ncbi:hypothetical protein SAMN03080617_00384 [Algoriphagus alkaliphilus]|uniref:Capsule assembly protein Wzi n=1 Tax=Algoriphagus alkaliphilus TaxID=279824 RepID=A0A1G5VA30_9BACT|nr:hypothetical protein [Algoriphagus alkaliphilus]MBA4299319.1 hypothetical protein [Cyclobacterium sp.]SDA42699.1 hypothetical protein SAMN03080617_00384 [Algoriphagus alkaliphilus]